MKCEMLVKALLQNAVNEMRIKTVSAKPRA